MGICLLGGNYTYIVLVLLLSTSIILLEVNGSLGYLHPNRAHFSQHLQFSMGPNENILINAGGF